MTATEILRRMLDEHDEYYKTSGNKTWWGRPIDRQTGKPINVFHYQAQPMGEDRLLVELQLATPEQAIAATLGSCNCSNSERTSDSDATAERRGDAVEVVWCRDCKHYTPESMTREERGFGVYENMLEPGGCFNPERCSATWDSIAGQMVPVGIVTEPDGFCAWGERKEGE